MSIRKFKKRIKKFTDAELKNEKTTLLKMADNPDIYIKSDPIIFINIIENEEKRRKN